MRFDVDQPVEHLFGELPVLLADQLAGALHDDVGGVGARARPDALDGAGDARSLRLVLGLAKAVEEIVEVSGVRRAGRPAPIDPVWGSDTRAAFFVSGGSSSANLPGDAEEEGRNGDKGQAGAHEEDSAAARGSSRAAVNVSTKVELLRLRGRVKPRCHVLRPRMARRRRRSRSSFPSRFRGMREGVEMRPLRT